MERHRSLWKAFLSKEKLFLVTVIFIFIIISTIYSFQQSIFSSPGYQEAYPNAGLEFFYSIVYNLIDGECVRFTHYGFSFHYCKDFDERSQLKKRRKTSHGE